MIWNDSYMNTFTFVKFCLVSGYWLDPDWVHWTRWSMVIITEHPNILGRNHHIIRKWKIDLRCHSKDGFSWIGKWWCLLLNEDWKRRARLFDRICRFVNYQYQLAHLQSNPCLILSLNLSLNSHLKSKLESVKCAWALHLKLCQTLMSYSMKHTRLDLTTSWDCTIYFPNSRHELYSLLHNSDLCVYQMSGNLRFY